MPFPCFQFGIHPLDIYFRQTNPFFQLWFQLLLCKISWFLKWLDCFVRPMRNCSKFSLLFLLIIPLIQLQNPPLVRTWGIMDCSCPLSELFLPSQYIFTKLFFSVYFQRSDTVEQWDVHYTTSCWADIRGKSCYSA